MGVIQKINPFNKNEDYSEAKQAKKEAGIYLKEQEKILNDREHELEIVEASLAAQHEHLVGKKGLIDTAKAKIAQLKAMSSYGGIKQAVNDSIESMLKLIAIFIFKTLLMPMAFLLLLLRAFKLIWGIDPRSLIKGSPVQIKEGVYGKVSERSA